MSPTKKNAPFKSTPTQHSRKNANTFYFYSEEKRQSLPNDKSGWYDHPSAFSDVIAKPFKENPVLLGVQVVLSLRSYRGGKSGQHRAPYFLTGRTLTGDGQRTASATEN